jgi:hypothetical protein
MTEIISPLTAAPADAVAYYRAHCPPKTARRVGRIEWEPILLEMIEDHLTHTEAWGWAQAHHDRLGFKLPAEKTLRDWMTQLRAELGKPLRRRKPNTIQLESKFEPAIETPTALVKSPPTAREKTPDKTNKTQAQIRNEEEAAVFQKIADETRQMGTEAAPTKSDNTKESNIPEFVGPTAPSVTCTKEETEEFQKLRKDALAAYIAKITELGYEFLEPYDGFRPPKIRKIAETAPY